MKTTFISTVFNEEETVLNFLNSIKNQNVYPSEVIIVDGRSTDNTLKTIQDFIEKNKKINIKLLKKNGNIATGRNEAIKNAKNEIILCSDSGCTLDKDWVRNMIDSFEDKNIDVVAGYYRPVYKNAFEKCVAVYTSVMPDRVDPENFLPSSRSVAFKKTAWKKVGGYPEWLDTCEDLYFARELKRLKFNFKFVKKTVVFWPQRKNLKEAFIQFYRYAKGDGMARYVRPNTPFLFGRYAIGITLVLIAFKQQSMALFFIIITLLVGYILWSITKNYKYIKNSEAIIYLPILQFTADVAVLSGMSIGLIQSLGIKRA